MLLFWHSDNDCRSLSLTQLVCNAKHLNGCISDHAIVQLVMGQWPLIMVANTRAELWASLQERYATDMIKMKGNTKVSLGKAQKLPSLYQLPLITPHSNSKDVKTIASFNVLRIINEPSTTNILYGLVPKEVCYS